MTEKELQDYLNKLKEFETELSSDDDVDDGFINEINKVIGQLFEDASQHNKSKPTTNPYNVRVGVKKLDPNAVIPSYSKVGDAGMDLTITNIKENTTFSITYGFGIAMEIPFGYVGLVFPRSSVRNQELILSNCVGVIDSGYRGELQATFKKTQGLDSISYNVGDRGAQIIILPYPQIEMFEKNELTETERGDGGFGSTGK
jgi:dUTP pyrophosphatase